MRSNLHDAYVKASVLTPAGDGTSPASAVVGRERDYVSVGTQGEPVLLLSCEATHDLRRPPISLRHLSVEYGIRYRIRTSASEIVEANFVVVSLRGDDLTLSEPFCLACDILLAALPAAPSASDIDKVVRELVEMMTALSLPSSKAVTGLWAELWLMSVASNCGAAIAAWHGDTTDRFDFAFSTHFVEVKATEREERTHGFSYEQLRRADLPVRVVSVRLRRAQNGASIADLVNAILAGLPQQMREKVLRNVFGAIGSAVSEAAEIRFDESFADANLRCIAAVLVPVVEIPSRSPISAVHFRVNLSDSSLAASLARTLARDALVAEHPRTL